MLVRYSKYLFSKRAVRYLFVGGLSFFIEISALFLLQKLGLSDLVSVAISFWVGLLSAFLLQKVVTFQNRSVSSTGLARQFSLYLALVFFNYVITLVAVGLLTPRVDVYLLRTLIIIVATVWNYYFYKFLFRNAATE